MNLSPVLLRQVLTQTMAAPLTARMSRDVHYPSVAGNIVALTGVRGSGKTSLLERRAADRVTSRSPREAHLILDLEDERLAGMTAADLEWLIEEHGRTAPGVRDNAVVSLYLDEIERVAGWEGLVRRLMESRRFEIFLAGSTSELMSRSSWLEARSTEVPVHPFSLREVLRHGGKEPAGAWTALTKTAKTEIEEALRTYLEVGGFPEAQGLARQERKWWLAGIVDRVLLRDLIEPCNVSNPHALRWLHRHLMAHAARGFTLRSVHEAIRELEIPIGRDLLNAYLAFIEEACLVRTISMRSDSERQQMVNPRKVYPIDPGLIGLFEPAPGAWRDRALETVVFLELDRRGYFVQWMRTAEGIDVDFFAEHDTNPPLVIQVRSAAVSERWGQDVRGLQTVVTGEPDAIAMMITLEPTPPAELPQEIHWYPLSQWLLEGEG